MEINILVAKLGHHVPKIDGELLRIRHGGNILIYMILWIDIISNSRIHLVASGIHVAPEKMCGMIRKQKS